MYIFLWTVNFILIFKTGFNYFYVILLSYLRSVMIVLLDLLFTILFGSRFLTFGAHPFDWHTHQWSGTWGPGRSIGFWGSSRPAGSTSKGSVRTMYPWSGPEDQDRRRVGGDNRLPTVQWFRREEVLVIEANPVEVGESVIPVRGSPFQTKQSSWEVSLMGGQSRSTLRRMRTVGRRERSSKCRSDGSGEWVCGRWTTRTVKFTQGCDGEIGESRRVETGPEEEEILRDILRWV